jgi:integrase/recombinase XerD
LTLSDGSTQTFGFTASGTPHRLFLTSITDSQGKSLTLTLRRFITWCDERGLKQPADITRLVLERYQRHLFYYRKADGKPLTLGTQAVCLATIKLWFKWLTRENHLLYNPASELELPHKSRRLPRVILSVPEVESILAQADVNSPAGIRDRALLELLYSSGLRRMEAARLAIYDIDFDRRLVMVREGTHLSGDEAPLHGCSSKRCEHRLRAQRKGIGPVLVWGCQ